MRKRDGITLISLVITIIIMLILTAVGLSLAFGNDGLFKKATVAKERQLQAETIERLKLTVAEVNADLIEKEGRICTKEDVLKHESFTTKFELEEDKIKDKTNGVKIAESELDKILAGVNSTNIDGYVAPVNEEASSPEKPDTNAGGSDTLKNPNQILESIVEKVLKQKYNYKVAAHYVFDVLEDATIESSLNSIKFSEEENSYLTEHREEKQSLIRVIKTASEKFKDLLNGQIIEKNKRKISDGFYTYIPLINSVKIAGDINGSSVQVEVKGHANQITNYYDTIGRPGYEGPVRPPESEI